MSDPSTLPDRLATLLAELRGRLGPDFANRRRVVSLVADRLPEAGRELKVLGTALDDGVVDTLEAARGGRLDLEIDRIATAFEARHGVRSDIARPVVQALAYALGLTGLPSASGLVQPSMPQTPAGGQDDWVGASSVVVPPGASAPQPAPAAVTTPTAPAAPPPAPRSAARTVSTWLWRGLGVFGAVIGVLLVIGLIVGEDDKPPANPQPQPVAQNDQPPPPPPPPPPQQPPQPPPQQPPQPPPVTPQTGKPPAADVGGLPPVSPGGPQRQTTPQLPPGYDVARLQGLSAQELQDFGVPPPQGLHQGAPHAPTPTTIPGGRVIDTLHLIAMLSQNPPQPMALVDALGGPDKLPNAIPGASLSQGGSFNDNIQSQMRNTFRDVNRDLTIVTYCADPHCWMSYNAALRFINLGFRNVYWYRGGLWAWQAAGMRTEPAQQQQQPRPMQQKFQ